MAGPPSIDRSAATQLRGYAQALLMVAASTLVGLALAPRWGNSAVDLLYLPAVFAAAALAGLGPALLAALASVLAYNYFYTAPRLTFQIDNANDIVTVVVLSAVAVVTSHLAASIRKQARAAKPTRHAMRPLPASPGNSSPARPKRTSRRPVRAIWRRCSSAMPRYSMESPSHACFQAHRCRCG